jgi:N-acetylmuramoyl-L-alanine amidase
VHVLFSDVIFRPLEQPSRPCTIGHCERGRKNITLAQALRFVDPGESKALASFDRALANTIRPIRSLRFEMSANPTRVDWETALATDPGAALREGNRVLESIARQEALPSLLAFSEFRVSIRNRPSNTQSDPAADLSQTERFVLDEVLQLISDRALAITGADGVMIALAEGADFVCRAASGSVLVERGTRMSRESEFLAECVDSGLAVRCDDAGTDARVQLDLTKQLGASASIVVPLRGQHARLGVIQAFSKTPFAFTDSHISSLDLFAELVLSALKPEDQDRRIHWLSDVAGEVLCRKSAPVVIPVVESPALEECAKPIQVEQGVIAPSRPLVPIAVAAAEIKEIISEPVISEPIISDPVMVEPVIAVPDFHFSAEGKARRIKKDPETKAKSHRAIRLLPALTGPSARPGLNVVMGLVAVAALFSAGVWWGMRGAMVTKVSSALQPVAAPAALVPGSPTPQAMADNLMDPSKFTTNAAPPSADRLAVLPKITGLRHWSSSVGSTVVIDMEDQVPYEVHRLSSPERIFFDLHDAVLAPPLDGKTIEVGEAALTRIRVAQPVAGVTRVVLDTKGGSNFSISMESNPYRLVVELRATDRAAANRPPVFAGHSAAIAALSPVPVKPEEQLAIKTGKFRIVLDAGHGGWDLGSVGRQGLLEKDLVLDVTQRLGQLLRTRLASEVVFTRTGDLYLPLDQRADLANQSQADLFVSVHANYSASATARGVETYYTNLFSAPGSKEIEKRENGDLPKPMTVSLSASGLHEKIEESRRLAASVQRSLYATLAAKSPGIRDRGIKDSAFTVLTGTTMPAILTEISFVSSPADEQKLQSEAYRQQIAEALYEGIARYQQSAQHAKVAGLQPASTPR